MRKNSFKFFFELLRVSDMIRFSKYMTRSYANQLYSIFFAHPLSGKFYEMVAYAKRTFSGFSSNNYYALDNFILDVKQAINIDVASAPLPDGVLGMFIPSNISVHQSKIVLNQSEAGLQLSNLGHEMGHVVAYIHKDLAQVSTEPIYFRNNELVETLTDSEEVFADAIMTVGAISKHDFQRVFCDKNGGIRRIYKLFLPLAALRMGLLIAQNYPEVAEGFLANDNKYFHKVLTIHVTLLRFLAYEDFGV